MQFILLPFALCFLHPLWKLLSCPLAIRPQPLFIKVYAQTNYLRLYCLPMPSFSLQAVLHCLLGKAGIIDVAEISIHLSRISPLEFIIYRSKVNSQRTGDLLGRCSLTP